MKEGWEYKKLGNVCDIFGRIGFRGYTKSDLVKTPKEGAITLSPSNIINGEMNYDKCSYISWAKYEESPEIKIKIGDILLVKTASVGKTAIVKSLPHEATINPQFVVFKNIKIDNYYLSYFLKSQIAQQFIWSIAKGAAAQTVSQKNLSELQVPIPPLSEQQQIVEYLDAQFKRIDALKANAEQQLQAAKDLFQAVLKELLTPKEGWVEKKLGEIADIKGGKRVPKGYKFETTKTAHIYIRVADFSNEGTISLDDLQYISDDVYEQIKRYTITSDDVYISIAGTIGKSGIIPKELNGANLTENACKLVLKGDVCKEFIYCTTLSSDFKTKIEKMTKVGAQPKLALTRLAQVDISFPHNISEQQQVAAQLDNLSAKVKQLQTNYEQTITLCNDLKQSLLKKVFE